MTCRSICELYKTDNLEDQDFDTLTEFAKVIYFKRPKAPKGSVMAEADKLMDAKKQSFTSFIKKVCIVSKIFLGEIPRQFPVGCEVDFNIAAKNISSSIMSAVFHGVESIEYKGGEPIILTSVKGMILIFFD